MYRNGLKAYPSERLNLINGWEQRGLSYWLDRLAYCECRIKSADSGTQLSRAIADRDVALAAITKLQKSI